MITNPDWKEPEFDLDSPDEGERTADGKFLVTSSQFFRNLSRAFHRMSLAEKAEFRRAAVAANENAEVTVKDAGGKFGVICVGRGLVEVEIKRKRCKTISGRLGHSRSFS